jgi:16S rRNA A1518/A1519 N6-dimethyltransferase RsmA/KsgA/DIM1 with predicted DNA glycosylase/AP lyase activity
VEIREGDFLRYRIKEESIRYSQTFPSHYREVVKAILFGENPPEEAYLVVQKEAAGKFTGNPPKQKYRARQAWFTLEVLREFRRTDFEPVPSVDVVFFTS